MVEVILFHHAGGLTDGVLAFASALRDAGHTVHTPDLFEGHRFDDVADGVAFAQSHPPGTMARRAAEAIADLPTHAVYGGMSMGAARAAESVLERPGARGAFFLYGAIAPSWWDAEWPAGVPSQAHVNAGDPWREVEAEEEYVAAVPDGELFVYEGRGHLFAEPGHPDHDADSAAMALDRVLALLGEL
ncbi:dienelactone hydrolase family protein [Demequina phytophila]|uniref:dienelactone hydrolase family protein n=1 Tax=Demequina phytophila TaxID=1638981 RepID=UPI0007814132|nr:dienelactone hydrolase family protein [Demequina phytophila]